MEAFMPFAVIPRLWCSYQLRKHEGIHDYMHQSTLGSTFPKYLGHFLSSATIMFSSLIIYNISTCSRACSWILGLTLFSDVSSHLLSSPGTEDSETRPADLQLQAVHREVHGPHHAGRPDAQRDRSRSLPADRQEHQREVRAHTLATRVWNYAA